MEFKEKKYRMRLSAEFEITGIDKEDVIENLEDYFYELLKEADIQEIFEIKFLKNLKA